MPNTKLPAIAPQRLEAVEDTPVTAPMSISCKAQSAGSAPPAALLLLHHDKDVTWIPIVTESSLMARYDRA